MDLPPGLLELIEDYVSDALDATGTRKAPRRAAPADFSPTPIITAPEPELERTEPDASNLFAYEESYAWLLPAIDDADEGAEDALLTQLNAQLAQGEPVIPDFSRSRTPRSSAPPPFDAPVDTDGAVAIRIVLDVELDDEPTAVVSKPA